MWIEWLAKDYLFEFPNNPETYCLGIYTNGLNSGSVYGGNFMRGMDVIFDRTHKTIGFAHSSCDSSFIKTTVNTAFLHDFSKLPQHFPLISSHTLLFLLISLFSFLCIYYLRDLLYKKRTILTQEQVIEL